jgi:hypothetical protein
MNFEMLLTILQLKIFFHYLQMEFRKNRQDVHPRSTLCSSDPYRIYLAAFKGIVVLAGIKFLGSGHQHPKEP